FMFFTLSLHDALPIFTFWKRSARFVKRHESCQSESARGGFGARPDPYQRVMGAVTWTKHLRYRRHRLLREVAAGKLRARERGARSEEHTSELQSPYDL